MEKNTSEPEHDFLVRDIDFAHEAAKEMDPYATAEVAAKKLGNLSEAQEHARNARIAFARATLKHDLGLHEDNEVYEEKFGGLEERKKTVEGAFSVDPNEKRNLERLSEVDELTGLANLKALNKALPAAESDEDTAVLVFDANNFGQVNKIIGQEAGDIALREMAESIYRAAELHKMEKRVFRRGGDEFVVLAPKDFASDIIEKTQEMFGSRQYGSGRKSVTLSLSGTAGDTFRKADEILQEAKARRKKELKRSKGWRRFLPSKR